jgi:hypothetical protein
MAAFAKGGGSEGQAILQICLIDGYQEYTAPSTSLPSSSYQ